MVNFNSTQSLFNLSLRQFIKAAKIDWHATSLDVQDKRDAVILDTALTYAQLAQLTGKIAALNEAQRAAEKGEFVSQQRFQEGVDSQLEVTRSQLVTARIRLRIAESARTSPTCCASICRSCWTCRPTQIAVEPQSMPQMPVISQDDDLAARAVSNSLDVKLAEQKVAAAKARAQGEHKALIMPTVDLASQYAYLAKFNNYDLYYRNYTANNFSGGLNIRFPIFNSVQKAKAQEADADAHNRPEASRPDQEQGQRGRTEASALVAPAFGGARRGQTGVGGFARRSGSGQGPGANRKANTRDQQNAELDTDDKHAAYLDAEFELSRAELAAAAAYRRTGELGHSAAISYHSLRTRKYI